MRPSFLLFLVVVLAAACAGEDNLPAPGAQVPPTDADPDGGRAADVATADMDAPGADAPPVNAAPGPRECARTACSGKMPDLCCPADCTASNDVDCGGCGNGRLEAGETCDPLDSCPTSCPAVACQKRRLKSEGTCAAVCVAAETETSCRGGDQCCPAGCIFSTDDDCPRTCVERDTEQVLRPGAAGADVAVSSLNPAMPSPGDHALLAAMAWTWDGKPGVIRGLLRFDLADVPRNVTLVSASLELFAEPSPPGPPSYGGHDALSGSNDGWLLRVLTPWDEAAVSWNSQPMTTQVPSPNQPTINAGDTVPLPASNGPRQDYRIDVTTMLREMLAGTVPNHGFLLRLTTEQHYRDLAFCSGDHADSARHPRLILRLRTVCPR